MKITVLGSGSSGNSTLIEVSNIKILIDVGFTYRAIKERLASVGVSLNEINYILITHDHKDHISGLSVLLNNYNPVVYMSEKIANIFFNAKYDNLKYLENSFKLNDVLVELIPTSHDATESDGFVITYKDESLVYITDTGYIHERLLKKITNKTYYIIESNHDINMLLNGKYPTFLKQRIYGDSGHLSNEACGIYLSKIIGENTKKIVLAHLSHENNSPIVALNTVKEQLKNNKYSYDLMCASQEKILEVTK